MLKRLFNTVFLGRRERGQSTAEFVVVVPFLFLIFFLIVDFGWLFKNWIVVTNAAREATRCAAVDTCNPVSFAQDQIEGGLGSNVLNTLSVQVRYRDSNFPPNGTIERGDSVQVCIVANNDFISPVIPFLSVIAGGTTLSDSIALRASNEMRLEQNPADNPLPSEAPCDS